jgi:hypothetical protein
MTSSSCRVVLAKFPPHLPHERLNLGVHRQIIGLGRTGLCCRCHQLGAQVLNLGGLGLQLRVLPRDQGFLLPPEIPEDVRRWLEGVGILKAVHVLPTVPPRDPRLVIAILSVITLRETALSRRRQVLRFDVPPEFSECFQHERDGPGLPPCDALPQLRFRLVHQLLPPLIKRLPGPWGPTDELDQRPARHTEALRGTRLITAAEVRRHQDVVESQFTHVNVYLLFNG